MGEKIFAIMSGCDWADAGVEFVILPEDADLEELFRKCEAESSRNWFPEWVLENGGRKPIDDELECIHLDDLHYRAITKPEQETEKDAS